MTGASQFSTVRSMTSTMIGSGLYDASEVAMLVGMPADQVVRWSSSTGHGPAPVPSSFDRLFSFDDLVALTITHRIRLNGISDRHLRTGVEQLRSQSGLSNPLASATVIERLATSGNSFLLHRDGNEFDDIGAGGQGVFESVVRLHLKRIEFEDGGGPARWRPVDGVLIDPKVQAGAPCLEGTRIPTAMVASRSQVEPDDEIAFDLAVELDAIEVAVRFEELLHQGSGLPA